VEDSVIGLRNIITKKASLLPFIAL
jgi:hypothetical protein